MTRGDMLRDAGITVVAAALAFGALDDITTDADTNFVLERLAVIACAGWFVLVSWRLVLQGHRTLGGLSFVVAAIAAVAQSTLSQDMVFWPWTRYVIAVLGLAWFMTLSGVLFWLGWQPSQPHVLPPANRSAAGRSSAPAVRSR
jgi:hypothetical protein